VESAPRDRVRMFSRFLRPALGSGGEVRRRALHQPSHWPVSASTLGSTQETNALSLVPIVIEQTVCVYGPVLVSF
jgi:hypothetical protein